MKLELKYNINDTVYAIWNDIVHECQITEIKYTNTYEVYYCVCSKRGYVGGPYKESDLFSNPDEPYIAIKEKYKQNLIKNIHKCVSANIKFYEDLYNIKLENFKVENDEITFDEVKND